MPSPLPIIVSNENTFIRWDELSCHQYRFTNKLNNRTLTVTITRIDGQDRTAITEFTLPPLGTSDVDLNYIEETDYGGDGVYEISVLPTVATIQTTTQVPFQHFSVSVIEFVGMSISDPISEVKVTGAITVYDEGVDGASTIVTPTNCTNAINAYMGANGTSVVLLPNILTVGYEYLGISTNYRLVLVSTNGVFLTEADVVISGEPTPLIATESCLYYFDPVSPAVGEDTITALWVNGVNILTRWYDRFNELSIFYCDVQLWIDANGGGSIADPDAPNFYIYLEECQDLEYVDYSLIEDIEEERLWDYIFELCDTYACYTKLERQWLCQDPCCTACTNEQRTSKKEARDMMLDISTLLQGGLMRLIANDRLQYLGDMGFYESRVLDINFIADYFTRLRKLVFKCGYGCADTKPCGCNGTIKY